MLTYIEKYDYNFTFKSAPPPDFNAQQKTKIKVLKYFRKGCSRRQ